MIISCPNCSTRMQLDDAKVPVRAYGGRVCIVGDPKDHSSTDMVGRVTGKP